MSNTYTPTTEEVRGTYVVHGFRECHRSAVETERQSMDDFRAEFDRWYTQTWDEAMRIGVQSGSEAMLAVLASHRGDHSGDDARDSAIEALAAHDREVRKQCAREIEKWRDNNLHHVPQPADDLAGYYMRSGTIDGLDLAARLIRAGGQK